QSHGGRPRDPHRLSAPALAADDRHGAPPDVESLGERRDHGRVRGTVDRRRRDRHAQPIADHRADRCPGGARHHQHVYRERLDRHLRHAAKSCAGRFARQAGTSARGRCQRDVGTTSANRPASDATQTYGFFALACFTTWMFAWPAALAWMQHRAPGPAAVALVGLSAFGPLIAVLAVAGPRKQLRQVFGRWRTNPVWIAVALATPIVVHLVATALFVAIGGRPDRWFHPPNTPE